MKHTPSLIVLLLLSACARVGSDAPQPVPVEAPRIPLKVYSKPFQAAVADELDALPAGSKVGDMIGDYGQTRRAVCAAEGWKQEACRIIRAARGSQ